MKTIYKIYSSGLAKEGDGYAHVTPMKTPDFDTEIEAEKYLETEYENIKQSHKGWEAYYFYYFIQKTYTI